MIHVSYSHHALGTELVHYEKSAKSHSDACRLIDSYPWLPELELTEKLGEGGGLYFLLGSEKEKYASYQLVPMGPDEGFLLLDIVANRGFLGVFGRKSVSENFDLVTISEAKLKLKELFDYSVDKLYEKYAK